MKLRIGKDCQKNKRFFEKNPKRSILYLFLILGILIQPILSVQKVSAAADYGTFDVSQSVYSKYYFYSVESCLASLSVNWQMDHDAENSNPHNYTVSELKNFQWFPAGMNANTNVVPLSIMEKTIASNNKIDDGKVWCDENANDLLKDAFSFWGVSSDEVFKNLVCANNGVNSGIFIKSPNDKNVNCSEAVDTFSFNYSGTTWDSSSNTGLTATTVFKNYIVNNVYRGDGSFLSGSTPTLSAAETYWLNKQIIIDFCGGGEISSTKPSDASKSIELYDVDQATNTQKSVWLNKSSSKWWDDGWGNEKNIPLWSGEVVYKEFGYPLPSHGKQTTTCSSASNSMNANVSQYIAYLKATGVTAGDSSLTKDLSDDKTEQTQQKTCGDVVTGMGWIVCPIVNALTGLNDLTWNIMVQKLLMVNPIYQKDSSGNYTSLYKAWGTIRNISNITFVIVFLIIIFSQLTSFGISNYGIKKMLPKLIVAAILVNVSFILMQAVVDLSNILGKGVYSLLISMDPGAAPKWESVVGMIITSGAAGTAVVLGISNPGVAIYLLLPMLITAALALLAALLTLMFRQVIIPVLAILAPLVFVANLLPNTESWYKKWKDMLTKMLLLYPLAAIVFGGAKFISSVIISEGSWWSYIVGLVALALPMFSLPFLAKSGGDLMNKFGGVLNGLANKASKPINDWGGRHREVASLKHKNSLMSYGGKNPFTKFQANNLKRRARFEAIGNFQKTELARQNAKYVSDETSDTTSGFSGKLAKGGSEGAQTRARANAINTLSKIQDEEVKSMETLIKVSLKDPTTEIVDLKAKFTTALENGDTLTALAAQNLLTTKGAPGVDVIHTVHSNIKPNSVNGETISKLRSVIPSYGLKGKDAALNAYGYSGKAGEIDKLVVEDTYSQLTPIELAGQNASYLGSTDEAGNIIKDIANISPERAIEVLKNPNAGSLLSPKAKAYYEAKAAMAVPKTNSAPAQPAAPQPQQTAPSIKIVDASGRPISSNSAQPAQADTRQSSTTEENGIKITDWRSRP